MRRGGPPPNRAPSSANYNNRMRQNQSRPRWLTTQSSADSGNDGNGDDNSTPATVPQKAWEYRPTFPHKIPHKPRRYFVLEDPHMNAFLKLKKVQVDGDGGGGGSGGPLANAAANILETMAIDDGVSSGGSSRDKADSSGYLGDNEVYDEMDTASGRVMECAICYRAFRPNQKPFGYTQCQHVVCVECMIKWICHPDSEGQTRDRCVVCRQQVQWTIISDRKVDEKLIEKHLRSGTGYRQMAIGNFFFVEENLEKEMEKLLQLKCPFGDGKDCSGEVYHLPFSQKDLEKFSDHVMNRHDQHICILCIHEMKWFAKDFVYYTRPEFLRHLKGHPSSSKINGPIIKHVPCPLCSDICFYFDHSRLLDHCRDEHLDCYICGGRKFFANQSALQDHLQSHHMYCGSCRIAYGTQTELYEHTRREHPNLAAVSGEEQSGANLITPPMHPELSLAPPSSRCTFDEIDSILRNKFRDEHDPVMTRAYDPQNTESYLINFPSIDGRGGVGVPPPNSSGKSNAPLTRQTYDSNFPALAQAFTNNPGTSFSSTSEKFKPKAAINHNNIINKKSVPNHPLTANNNNKHRRKSTPKFPELKISSSNPLVSVGAQQEWSRVSLISKPSSATSTSSSVAVPPKKPANFKNYDQAFPELSGGTSGELDFLRDTRIKKPQVGSGDNKTANITTGGRSLWSSTKPLDSVLAELKPSKPRGKQKKKAQQEEKRTFNGYRYHAVEDQPERDARLSQMIREVIKQRQCPAGTTPQSMYDSLEQLCYNYYQLSVIPAIILYESLEELLGSSALDQLIWPLISALPDIEKQNELYQSHMERLKRLGVRPKRAPAAPCSTCQQVVMMEDRDSHRCQAV